MRRFQTDQYEDGIINAILTWPEDHPKIFSQLQPEHFEPGFKQKTYKALHRLYHQNRDNPISNVAMIAEINTVMKADNTGWKFWINKLTEEAPYPTDLNFYISRIHKEYNRRFLTQASEKAKRQIEEGETTDFVIDNLKKNLSNMENELITKGPINAYDIIGDCIELISEGKKEIQGIPTHFKEIDKYIVGMRPGDLIIIAGRPSMGKTTLAMNIARNAAQKGYNGLVYSLEMSQYRLGVRMIASQSKIHMTRLTRGELKQTEYEKISESIGAGIGNLYIDFSKGMKPIEVERKIREFIETSQVDFIVLDYLQKLRFSGQKRHDLEVADATGMFKDIAGEFGISFILVSQLSRANEKDGKVRLPRLSDLRDSGAIEQDADIVAFIHRPEVYNKQDPALKNVARIDIAKNRDGETGAFKMTFQGHLNRFENYTENEGET